MIHAFHIEFVAKAPFLADVKKKSSVFPPSTWVLNGGRGVSMPTGRGEKRPAEANGCAIMVGQLATGEITEKLKEPCGKVRSGKAGSKARTEKLSPEDRTAIAKKAAVERWG